MVFPNQVRLLMDGASGWRNWIKLKVELTVQKRRRRQTDGQKVIFLFAGPGCLGPKFLVSETG
ncbi:hypothetical protein [Salimicrobium jeotgali]|uniref:hypothetical protein n=1 Tax=Salimicrobium jeotgali TaxID=1230341 RepID=UPI0015E0CD64|nr:hypothetical protein [Salimicrobium jeotgali]